MMIWLLLWLLKAQGILLTCNFTVLESRNDAPPRPVQVGCKITIRPVEEGANAG